MKKQLNVVMQTKTETLNLLRLGKSIFNFIKKHHPDSKVNTIVKEFSLNSLRKDGHSEVISNEKSKKSERNEKKGQ